MSDTALWTIVGTLILLVVVVASAAPRSGRRSALPDAQPHVRAEAIELVEQGRTIQAIKLVREHTRWSLVDAKNYVESLAAGDPTPPRPPRASEVGAEVEVRARDLVERGRAIHAVKLVREHTGWDLRTSKNYVDGLRAR